MFPTQNPEKKKIHIAYQNFSTDLANKVKQHRLFKNRKTNNTLWHKFAFTQHLTNL